MRKIFSAKKIQFLIVLAAVGLAAAALSGSDKVHAAACALPSTDFGTATTTVNIPATGSYRIWSRIKADAADATNNSYLLEIDGNTCFLIGNNPEIPQSNWFWVDYYGGSPLNNKVDHNFTTTGNHTIKMIGREANVSLDRVILTQDTSCVPTGTGDNCADPPDTTPPSVSLTSPSNGATVSGQVTVSASASDSDSGVQKVEFRLNGSLINTDNQSPYGFTWDSTTVSNGSHTLSAVGYDVAGNTATSASVNVIVQNESTDPDPDPSFMPEDINQDGTVNLLDFSLLASNFGQTGTDLGRTDINGDGTVNLLDFSLLAAKFGQSE